MLNNFQEQIGALGPRFRLPLEALSAIRALHGSVKMLDNLFVVPRAGPADSLFPLARRCRVLDVQRTTAKAPARRLPSTEPLHPLPCCRSDSMFGLFRQFRSLPSCLRLARAQARPSRL